MTWLVALTVRLASSYTQTEDIDLLAHDMLFQPTFEQEMAGGGHHQRPARRIRRQAIKGTVSRDRIEILWQKLEIYSM
jgi:hypothetical protein